VPEHLGCVFGLVKDGSNSIFGSTPRGHNPCYDFHSIIGLHIPLPHDLSRVRLRSPFLLSVTRTCTTSDSS